MNLVFYISGDGSEIEECSCSALSPGKLYAYYVGILRSFKFARKERLEHNKHLHFKNFGLNCLRK